ncbi:hypothetical protein GCM10010313_83060 [Streptomyces violarus]|nr:hypothetical protein GCM10010313_83060 [Streptomyces violarus]
MHASDNVKLRGDFGVLADGPAGGALRTEALGAQSWNFRLTDVPSQGLSGLGSRPGVGSGRGVVLTVEVDVAVAVGVVVALGVGVDVGAAA